MGSSLAHRRHEGGVTLVHIDTATFETLRIARVAVRVKVQSIKTQHVHRLAVVHDPVPLPFGVPRVHDLQEIAQGFGRFVVTKEAPPSCCVAKSLPAQSPARTPGRPCPDA